MENLITLAGMEFDSVPAFLFVALDFVSGLWNT